MGAENDPGAGEPPHGAFATTHWSVVLAAGGPSVESMAALEKLCRAYWYPLYSQVRRHGFGPEDAQDITQGFFASLLRHESLASIRREKGRFRTFLLTSLKYYLADEKDRSRAVKRGGGRSPIELDALAAEERYALEPATDETPDRLFDRQWAAAMIERALERLKHEQRAAGKLGQFDKLKVFLTRETLPGEYATISDEFGISTNAIAVAVQRLRIHLRELALLEVMQTVDSPTEAEAELRALLS